MSTAGTVDLPLDKFSGYVPEIAPSDLPSGASPKCQDTVFPLGAWRTRPGLGAGVFAALAGNPSINYQKTFIDQSQNKRFLFLDSGGAINQEFPEGNLSLGINSMSTLGSPRAKSATAYGKEYIAFSDGQFGVADPAQYDGTNYDRVSQVGPGAPPTVVDSGAAGNIVAGVHGCSVFFITRSGFWTKPAVAPFTWTAAGAKAASVTNIPTGPPNVVARVLVFTESGGATYFFTTNASNILPNGGMVINDNVTTTATVDFSDPILASGSNAQPLFDLLDLEPSAGVVSYATRLFWWGGLNRVPNFNNLSFDGGFDASPPIGLAGPNSPLTASSVVNPGNPPGGGGSDPWANPLNVLALDGAFAVNTATGHFADSDQLFAQGFGFAIPLGATILGIVATVQAKSSAPAGYITDGYVYALKGGARAGSNRGANNPLASTVAPIVYGAPTDLWGTTWTPAQINSATFGLEFTVSRVALATGFSAFVDYIDIQVYYTGAAVGAKPLGWTKGATFTGGNSAQLAGLTAYWGDAFSITGDGVTAVRGLITQSAYQDWSGNPILVANTPYKVRVKLARNAALVAGTLHINLQSTTGAFTTVGLAVPAANLTQSYQLFSGFLTDVAFGAPPADLLLEVYADGTPTLNGTFLVDGIEIYLANVPYLTSTIRASYAGQPESYDELTGVCQPYFQDGGTIRNMFVLRTKLYALKDNSWYETTDDGANEPSAWTWTPVSLAVGCCGINASDLGEDWGIVANRAGPYIFAGPEPTKIGQEIFSDSSNSGKPTWSSINWAFGYTIWVLLDRANKRALIGAPINGATSPNVIFYFDFVGMDTYLEVADHWSVKYSSYTGKILSIGNAPKWAPWNISSNSAALIERADGTAHTFIGNGSAPPVNGLGPSNTGKIYDLLDVNKSDEVTGIPWSYSTYLAPSHDEEQALQIKSHRKLYVYLAGYVKGSGAMAISLEPMGNITPQPQQNLQLVDPSVSNAITAISRVNGVTTVTCAGGHGFAAGIDVQAVIQNSANASFNGTVPIQQILNPTQFTFSQYLMPDLILGAGGTTQRLSREFEFTTNTLGERCSYTFSNAGNAAGSWAQMEKLIFSIVPDPHSPVRGSVY